MKKIFVLFALAALTLTACHRKAWYENDGIPVEPEPEPVITYEGEGKLVRDDVNGNISETNHTYSWKADETTINVVVNVDGSQYVNGDDNFAGGAFCAGWFTLDRYSINDFLGIDVKTDLTEENFYAVNPDGSRVEAMTSYKPGMWVDATGASCGWGDGRMFWQWYVWGDEEGGGYDMNANDYPDILYIGSNPGNVKDVLGKSVVSKAKIDVGGVVYDWIITVNFSEAEKMESGSGNLIYPGEEGDVETTSKYSWTLHETEGLTIDVEINTEEWQETGDWTIGFIPDLTQEFVQGILGFDPGALSDDDFYPVDASGNKIGWSSYAPGMWLNSDGTTSDYSAGVAYWQWYIHADPYYDYGYENRPGIFLVGGNPGNISKIEFETPIVSQAVMKGAGKELPFTLTYIFHDVILPETEGYPEAVFEGTGTPYPYGGGVDGDHTLQWYFDEAGLTVDVDAYIPSIEGWGFSAVVIPTDAVKAYLGIDDIETLFDPTYFYGINPDDSKVDYGDNHEVWSSYKPGMWVGEDGTQSGSGGVMFWQYQFGDHKYDGHFTEGLMVIGTNPGNVANVAGKTVTSRAKMGEKLLTVNVTFHAEYPTAKTGKVGPFSYSWTMTDAGLDIQSNVSISNMDESWAWMGFFINEAYINDKYGVDIAQLAASLDTFYPVDAEGNKLDNWTSYIPGMWFLEDGGAGAYDTGVSFWQYYTSNYEEIGYHDFQAPNLMYVGKNPGYAFHAGSFTSKAVFDGKEFNFTINIAE
jgi:hypothetical protein